MSMARHCTVSSILVSSQCVCTKQHAKDRALITHSHTCVCSIRWYFVTAGEDDAPESLPTFIFPRESRIPPVTPQSPFLCGGYLLFSLPMVEEKVSEEKLKFIPQQHSLDKKDAGSLLYLIEPGAKQAQSQLLFELLRQDNLAKPT